MKDTSCRFRGEDRFHDMPHESAKSCVLRCRIFTTHARTGWLGSDDHMMSIRVHLAHLASPPSMETSARTHIDLRNHAPSFIALKISNYSSRRRFDVRNDIVRSFDSYLTKLSGFGLRDIAS